MVWLNRHAQNWKRAHGARRGVPKHTYLVGRKLPRGVKPKLFSQLCKEGYKRIRNHWDAEADRRYCGSKQSRQELWALLVRWSKEQAVVSRVAMLPCVYLGHALAAHDLRCSRRTVARALCDLEKWGLVVVEPGQKYQETRVFLKLSWNLFPNLLRPILKAQWEGIVKTHPGSSAFRPWRSLIARAFDVEEVKDPGVKRKPNHPHPLAEALIDPPQGELPLHVALHAPPRQNVDTKDSLLTGEITRSLELGGDGEDPGTAYFRACRLGLAVEVGRRLRKGG